MLSVDPPDEDDSEEENAQQQRNKAGGDATPRQTGGPTPSGATGDRAFIDGGPGDGTPGERPLVNGDDKPGVEMIEIDGEGDAEPSNFDKESPSSVSVSY